MNFATPPFGVLYRELDYVLADWAAAGLLKPSYVRPKVATVEPALVVHSVGALSARDLLEVDRCLRRAMGLVGTALGDVLAEVDLAIQPAATVQALAEESVAAALSLAQVPGTWQVPGTFISNHEWANFTNHFEPDSCPSSLRDIRGSKFPGREELTARHRLLRKPQVKKA